MPRPRRPAGPRRRLPGIDPGVTRIPAALVRDMTEAQFQENVVRLAKRHGWLVCHVYPALTRGGVWVTPTTYKGFPDLTLLRRGQLLQLELKRVGEEGTTEQRRWIALAQTVPGVSAYIVSPTDWPEVYALLTAPRPDRT